MEAEAAKYIGAGLATLGMIGSAIGVGNIFANFLNGALRNPSAAGSQVGNLFVGAALAEALGILAFVLDIAAGILFGKLLNVATHGKFNPLIGAAGISAFPMAARVVNRVGLEEDYDNFLLMHAMGANAAGQVASTVAGGVLLALMGAA